MFDIVKMQSSGGFIENIEGASGIAFTQLTWEFHSLGFTAGEGGGTLTEFDIAKSNWLECGEFAFDWETRKYFTSYAANFIKSESVDSTFMQKTRLGFAPYIAGYGALHTWLMYELQNMPEYDDALISNFVL